MPRKFVDIPSHVDITRGAGARPFQMFGFSESPGQERFFREVRWGSLLLIIFAGQITPKGKIFPREGLELKNYCLGKASYPVDNMCLVWILGDSGPGMCSAVTMPEDVLSRRASGCQGERHVSQKRILGSVGICRFGSDAICRGRFSAAYREGGIGQTSSRKKNPQKTNSEDAPLLSSPRIRQAGEKKS